MAIHSFLKAEKGDPDWQFSPDCYFNKEFKIIDANSIELPEGVNESFVLRQTPTERQLLAKHLKINIKTSSLLDLTVINDADSKLEQVFLYDINLEEGSAINLYLFVNGGKLNKHIIQVNVGDESRFNLVGLVKNDSKGNAEIITKVVQRTPKTENNQFVACLSGKNGQTVFQSMTILDQDCAGSTTAIDGVGLTIESTGKCFIKPEIFTNSSEVNTVYSSSIRRIDNEQLYYFKTLGIDEKTATDLIIKSFTDQCISFINAPDVQEEIKQIYF